MQILGHGAEAVVFRTSYLGLPAVRKRRVPKKYRHEALDQKISSKRQKQECFLLHAAKQAMVRCPVIFDIDLKNREITMEFLLGKKLKHALSKKNFPVLCKKTGGEIGKLHSNGIIHGDLTTDNLILCGKRIAFVDFGLGFFSGKTGDFATDLLSLKKTFLSTHFELKGGFERILAGYKKTFPKAAQVIAGIARIEARTRYS